MSPRGALEIFIHSEGANARTPHRGLPANLQIVRIEAKMLFPEIAARVKQGHGKLRFRIDAETLTLFEGVAGAARQRQVFQVVASARESRNDMFDFVAEVIDRFGRSATAG